MEWLLLFSLVSGLANFWQYGENQELETKLAISNRVAKECQRADIDEHELALIAANDREQTNEAIRRISARSELNIRNINQSSGGACDLLPSKGGVERVQSHIDRTDAINRAWLRGSGEGED